VSLKQTQTLFMEYLLGGGERARESDAVNVEPPLSEFASLVEDQSGISVDKRMRIYANAYRERLKETIDTDHEILGLYLGDELFETMVANYIDAHPSSFHSLRQFCDALPQFLREDDFFGQYCILSDLARFERQLMQSFDAADSARASFSDLQAIDAQLWPGIQLRFHASVQVFRCESNAVESWQALKQGQAPPEPDYGRPRVWMLWRGIERISEFVSLNPDQLALLEGFVRGRDFAQQCERMLEWHDPESTPGEVLSTLQTWFERGIVRAVVSSAA
jgi:hypothetical protein